MGSDKQQGFVLYFDSLNALHDQVENKQISAEDAFSVISAIGHFAQTGAEPVPGSLSPVASMAYAMMICGVKKSLEKYADRRRKNREAANARWNCDAQESSECNSSDHEPSICMQTHANACNCMQMDAKHADTEHDSDTEIEHDVEVEEISRARAREGNAPASAQCAAAVADLSDNDDHGDLQERIRMNQVAMRMIEQYRLPDSPVTLDAVLVDLERHGEATLDRALREACNANSRDRLSVNFYRSVLSRMTGGATARGTPRAAPVFEQRDGREMYEGFEVYGG